MKTLFAAVAMLPVPGRIPWPVGAPLDLTLLMSPWDAIWPRKRYNWRRNRPLQNNVAMQGKIPG